MSYSISLQNEAGNTILNLGYVSPVAELEAYIERWEETNEDTDEDIEDHFEKMSLQIESFDSDLDSLLDHKDETILKNGINVDLDKLEELVDEMDRFLDLSTEDQEKCLIICEAIVYSDDALNPDSHLNNIEFFKGDFEDYGHHIMTELYDVPAAIASYVDTERLGEASDYVESDNVSGWLYRLH